MSGLMNYDGWRILTDCDGTLAGNKFSFSIAPCYSQDKAKFITMYILEFNTVVLEKA